jgi:voltage-gated potassium channel
MDSLSRRLRIFLIVMSSIMILSAIGLMIVENLSFVDSIYFTVVTVASVGYGYNQKGYPKILI